eukprot:gene5820-6517_t
MHLKNSSFDTLLVKEFREYLHPGGFLMDLPSATPFASLKTADQSVLCCLCKERIRKSEKSQVFKEKGWESIREKALQWKCVTSPRSYALNFPYAHDTLKQHFTSKANNELKCHTQCRKHFGDSTKLQANLSDSAPGFDEEPMLTENEEQSQASNLPSTSECPATRSKVDHLPAPSDHNRKCFVCNKGRKKLRGHEETLMKLQEPRAEAKLISVLDENKHSDDPILQSAAKRLQIHQAGGGDLFARELDYHKSCYKFFTRSRTVNIETDVPFETMNAHCAEEEFLKIIEVKVISEKCCYFLVDLLEDLQSLYDFHVVPIEGASRKTFASQVKDMILRKFEGKVDFARASGVRGSGNILHSVDVNPLDYSLATLQGAGLRDDDITKAFANMINRKVKCLKQKQLAEGQVRNEQISFDELVAQLDEHEPLQQIYNAIGLSLHPSAKKNEHGYVVLSSLQANKVWSIAGTWQQLLTGEFSSTSLALGMVIHRVTGSKETINLLKGQTRAVRNSEDVCYDEFRIGKPKAPPTIKAYDCNDDKKEIDHRLSKDCAWALAAMATQTLSQDTETPQEDSMVPESSPSQGSTVSCNNSIGSWTAFNKKATSVATTKSRNEYLPTISHPPDDKICKYYLDYILDMAGSLHLEHIFVHCDQAVFYKMSQIMWKECDKYKKVICLMGGFHTLLVWLKVLHKQFGCLGFRDWWCESGIIAEGSVDQAAEGRHYSRSMRLHKQSLEALLRFKGSEVEVSRELAEVAKALASSVSPTSLEAVLSHPNFKTWKNEILKCSGTMGTFLLKYIFEVSTMLSFVVRPARTLSTGIKISPEIVTGLLEAKSAAEATIESPPLRATTIYDGMAVIRASKPTTTWGQYMANQLKAFTPPSSWYVQETVIVFDNYIDDQEYSIKDAERQERGCSARVHLGTNEQKMMNGKDFQMFMHNKENKDELIKRFVEFTCLLETRSNFNVPCTVNHRNTTLTVTPSNVAKLAVKQKSLPLLEKLGDEKSLHADWERDITNFIHKTIYNGKENDDLVTTRINEYDKLRVKTTQSIIPDPGSLKYLIERANLATYYLKHFSLPVVEKVSVSESGWIREETGHLLPLCTMGHKCPD